MGKYTIDPTPMSSYIRPSIKEKVFVEPNYELKVDASAPPMYDLYAMRCHYDESRGGHYAAYAENNGKWYQFNDDSIHEVSEDSLQDPGAYMLFYRRRCH